MYSYKTQTMEMNQMRSSAASISGSAAFAIAHHGCLQTFYAALFSIVDRNPELY
jgi:hypothetical protein